MTSTLFSFTFSNPLVSGVLALMVAALVLFIANRYPAVLNNGLCRLMFATLLLTILTLILSLGLLVAKILTGAVS